MINRFGGCQCGEIRYVLLAPPLTVYICHCRDCQKQSASSFGMSMPVRREGFRIVQGEPALWYRTAASGRLVACAFCKSCGTRIYHAPERNSAIVNIKPGTFDDPSDLVPVRHVWVKRALPWLRPLITGLVFEDQPADFEPFFTAWAELHGMRRP